MNDGDWVLCLHCNRVYRSGEFREVAVPEAFKMTEKEKKYYKKHGFSDDDIKERESPYRMCPFEGCDGDAVGDQIEWKNFQEHFPEFPVIPEYGKKYDTSIC